MMRITKKELNSLSFTFNKTFDRPVQYLDPTSPIRETCIGHFYIEQAGARYKLCQIVSKTGGARDVFNLGYLGPRPPYDLLQAYLSGAHEQRRAITKATAAPAPASPQQQESK